LLVARKWMLNFPRVYYRGCDWELEKR
jgi:hypothetical protein